MLCERLYARCPSAESIGVGVVSGREVAFLKKSVDGSGKATLCESIAAKTFGVVFELDEAERDILDKVEGREYRRVDDFRVILNGAARAIFTSTYLARSETPNLQPYGWYLALLIAGAKQHGLPSDYIECLRRMPFVTDDQHERKSRCEAIRVLVEAGFEEMASGEF